MRWPIAVGVCLLLDNCSAHHIEDLNLMHVEIRFFPPNCTTLIQPLDQGIIQSLKCAYRVHLIDRMLTNIRLQRETKVDAIVAVEVLAASWQTTKRETITNSFKHAGFQPSSDCDDGDVGVDRVCNEQLEGNDVGIAAKWDMLRETGDVPEDVLLKDFLSADSSAICTEELTEQDIIAGVQGTVDEDDSDSDCEETSGIPAVGEVLNAIDVLRRYAASHENQEAALGTFFAYE